MLDLKHDLRGTGSCRHYTGMSQPLCGTAEELQLLTKLSSIQNCPVMCLSDLSYNGSKGQPVTGTSEVLNWSFWLFPIYEYRLSSDTVFGQHFEL